MPLDPQAAALIELIDASGLGELTPMTDPQVVRDLLETMTAPSSIAIAHVEDRMIPGPGGELPVRIFCPSGDDPKPAIVYFHGGGWVIGSRDSHDGLCRSLVDAVGAVVVSVDYRLAPEDPFPAAVNDAFAAACWVQANAEEIGVDPGRIAVAGDSAGGNLAAVVAQLARDAGGPNLCFQLLVYPATDYECDRPSITDNAEGYFLTTPAMQWFYSHYLKDAADGIDPRMSPIRGNLNGLPPAFVITAEYDPLRDQGIAYAEALAAAGNEVTSRTYGGMFHGFFGMQEMIDASQVALDDAAGELRGAFGMG